MDIRFNGKRALVTGAGKGIGRVATTMLAQCGAKVIAVSRTQADLDSLKQEFKGALFSSGDLVNIRKAPNSKWSKIQVPDVETICLDISDWDATKTALENVGPVHLLVNNAGIGKRQTFFEITKETFDDTINTNVRAVIQVSQIIAKGMVERGEGAIVNVSSQASKVAIHQETVYCTSKGALDSLTQGMALELGPKGIRVNAVNPTITMTPLGVKAWGDPKVRTNAINPTVVMTPMGVRGWSDPKVGNPVKQRIPLRRFAETEEVVQTILYLLSDKSSFINGVTLPVDGGFLAAGIDNTTSN